MHRRKFSTMLPTSFPDVVSSQGLQSDDDFRPELVQQSSVSGSSNRPDAPAYCPGWAKLPSFSGGFQVGREIIGALKRILEGRIFGDSCRSVRIRPDSPGIAHWVLRPTPSLSGAHQKGHHRRFGRGDSGVAMGRALVTVFNWFRNS